MKTPREEKNFYGGTESFFLSSNMWVLSMRLFVLSFWSLQFGGGSYIFGEFVDPWFRLRSYFVCFSGIDSDKQKRVSRLNWKHVVFQLISKHFSSTASFKKPLICEGFFFYCL